MTHGNGTDALLDLPPHSDEAERGVLGSILLDADPARAVDKCAVEGITSHSFYVLSHRQIWSALAQMANEFVPIDLVTLSVCLRDRGELDGVGGLPFIATLPDATPSAAHVSYYVQIVEEKRRRRAALADGERLIRLARDAAPAEFAEGSRALHEIGLESASGTSESRIDSFLASRMFDLRREPAESVPVYSLGGTTICTRGNISAITAAAKAGKSAFVGALIAARIAQIDGGDTFGIAAHGTGAVVHIDTEQSLGDHWRGIRTAMRRAGVDAIPPWVRSYCLTGEPALFVLRAIRSAVAAAARDLGPVHSVIIDGVADCAIDVNDAAESNALVSELHGLAIEHHCAVIGVIHFNPGSEKVRGHLGSQLERKAESNIRLEKDNEVTDIFSGDQRRAPIPREAGHRFAWSSERGMHVTAAGGGPSAKESAKLGLARREAEEIFGTNQSMKWGALIDSYIEVHKRSRTVSAERVSDWLSWGVIVKEGFGIYSLGKS